MAIKFLSQQPTRLLRFFHLEYALQIYSSRDLPVEKDIMQKMIRLRVDGEWGPCNYWVKQKKINDKLTWWGLELASWLAVSCARKGSWSPPDQWSYIFGLICSTKWCFSKSKTVLCSVTLDSPFAWTLCKCEHGPELRRWSQPACCSSPLEPTNSWMLTLKSFK